MDANRITDKQVAYICNLVSAIEDRPVNYLSQCANELGLSHRQIGRLTRREASQIIDDLRVKIDG